jgi:hypothetical protein
MKEAGAEGGVGTLVEGMSSIILKCGSRVKAQVGLGCGAATREAYDGVQQRPPH